MSFWSKNGILGTPSSGSMAAVPATATPVGWVAGAWGGRGPLAHLEPPAGLEGARPQHHCLEGHQRKGLWLVGCPRCRAPARVIPPNLGLRSRSSSEELAADVGPLLAPGLGLRLYRARGVQDHPLILLYLLPLLFCEGFHGRAGWMAGEELALSVPLRLS